METEVQSKSKVGVLRDGAMLLPRLTVRSGKAVVRRTQTELTKHKYLRAGKRYHKLLTIADGKEFLEQTKGGGD